MRRYLRPPRDPGYAIWRANEMMAMRNRGATLHEIGDEWNLGDERVRQILNSRSRLRKAAADADFEIRSRAALQPVDLHLLRSHASTPLVLEALAR